MSRLFRSPSLGVKLNIIVLFVLSIFLVSTVFLLNQNTQNLTEQIGGDRVREEVISLENRLAEINDKLLVDINFLATGVYFVQAVGSRNETNIAEIINTANVSLKLDDITVVDGDGKRLIDTAIDEDSTEEDALLAQGLDGQETSALLVEQDGAGGIQISIAAVAPIVNTTGNVLGAIQMSRLINSEFLEMLTFGREAVHLGLIHEGQIIVRTSGHVQAGALRPDDMLANGIVIDREALDRAYAGEIVILDNLVPGETGVPHMVAYTPIWAGGDCPAVVMILVELEEIYLFQNRTLDNTVLIFTALTLLAVSFIYLAIYQTTIRPLNELKAIAQTMTSGQYDESAPVKSQDEVGQLAVAFNEMANAIQQREISLEAALEQAERADRTKSMFLASMSHELRTPLNAIINLTKFVAQGMYGEINAEQEQILYQVAGSGKHLLNLINDVLDISKIEAESLELFVEEGLHIDEIIKSIVETSRGLLLERPITLHSEIVPGLPTLTGDEQRIRQIVLNLLSNACKFTEEGEIVVRAYREADELLVEVQDTGPGIDPKEQEAIFEVFRQAKVRGRKAEGTGLGLPISRRLAEAHGGRLWVQSTLGQGATFYVALPINSPLEPTV
ncbi:MAG: HAMP domain-containing protein [Anaerolineae bacterium]|nr:HAMP domain-containing protein [Anaerolineae bacterium]